MLGRAGLVDSPAGMVVHGVCGGVPIVPGEGGRQAAATVGVAALLFLVLARLVRLVKHGCCPWPRSAPRGGQLALRGSVVVVMLLHRCCDGPMRGAVRSRSYVVTSMLGLASMLLRIEILSWSKLVYVCYGEYDSPSHSRFLVRSRRGSGLNDRASGGGPHTTPCGVQGVRYTEWDRPSSSIRLSGPPGSLHAPRHSVASSIRTSNRPESPRRACPTPSPATAVHSVPSRDLERSSRLEGDCCQCEREPRALLSRVGPSSMPVVVGRHEYVIKIRCSSPPH